jgi:hypothetical protein
MKKGWRIFFGSCAVIFLVFALLQLNDPDPHFWVPAYLLPGFMAALAAFKKFPLSVLPVLVGVYLIVALFFWPENILGWVQQEWEQKDLTMKTQEMEINREFFGLLLIALVMGLAYFVGRNNRKNKNL